MRQFDNRTSYFDNKGNILIGRAIFCDKNGVESVIRDVEGNVIDSVVYTDNAGRLYSQVFLENHDYLVKFSKYIGNTSMNDDEDDDNWEPQFEVKNLYDTMNINVALTGGLQCVNSISDLRKLNPESIHEDNSNRVVMLLGYLKPGDKPSICYKWDESVVANDDGGSVIKVQGISQGRWTIVQSYTYVDVRHFGASPKMYEQADMSNRLAVQKAQVYATSIGQSLYFYADENCQFYDVSNINLNNVTASSNVKLYCMDDCACNIYNVESIYVYSATNYEGSVNLYGNVLRTSFDVSDLGNVKFHPNDKIILDSDYHTDVKWTNVEVEILVNQTKGGSFENCSFVGGGNFGGVQQSYSFKNCYIRQSIFNPNVWCTKTFDDCTSNVKEWETADDYIEFCIQCETHVIDLEWGTATDDHFIEYNFILRNALVYGELTVTNSATIETGCVVAKLNTGSGVVSNLSITGSNVTFYCPASASERVSKVRTIVIDNSNIVGFKLSVETIRMTNSSFNSMLNICPNSSCKVSSYIRNCVIYDNSPSINTKTIDGSSVMSLGSIVVDGLYIIDNIYEGNNNDVITFMKNYMSSTQGKYRISNNVGVDLNSEGERVCCSGKILLSNNYNAVSAQANTFVVVNRQNAGYVTLQKVLDNCHEYFEGCYEKFATTLYNFIPPIFNFGETNNSNKNCYTIKLSLKGVQQCRMSTGAVAGSYFKNLVKIDGVVDHYKLDGAITTSVGEYTMMMPLDRPVVNGSQTGVVGSADPIVEADYELTLDPIKYNENYSV